ncbi:MAG: alpha/beta hydrolase [Desulfobacterales bacterium]|nr:alpha/beta hydrolase [Desulfobacterales bacterium]
MSGINGLEVAETALGPIEYFQRDTGRDSDKIILSIHGAMGGYDQSDILGRTIGPTGYRYISISRPGYLRTPLKGRETAEAQADLIAALLDFLHISKVIVFAISGGGYSALHFALRHQERCSALVLCSTTGGRNSTPIPFSFNVIKILAHIPLLTNMMRKRVEKNIERSLKKSISYSDILYRTIKDHETVALFKELSIGMMNEMPKRLPGTINDIKITQTHDYALNEIKVPSLIVHGTDDPIVGFNAHGKRLAGEIPGARLYAAQKGEHAAIFTHRIEVRTAVADFLKILPNS